MSAPVHPVADNGPLLRIEGLSISLPAQADRRHAVEDVSLALARNEILCVVGESGSGKSVMSRAVLGLFPSRHVQPSAGRIVFEGQDRCKPRPSTCGRCGATASR